ncbi:MAG: type IV pilus modification PilV family protein [Patescibacteria group bacterium]
MLRKFFIKNKKNNLACNKSAFTLVEVITVLLVISIGMTGVMSLIVQNIKSQSINKNTLVAYQLAQEGIELIRKVRDTNWLTGTGAGKWKKNLSAGNYYMDYESTIPVSATTKASGRLSQDDDGMYYSDPISDLPEGFFSRIINISYPNGSDKNMLVRSNVYWTDRGKNYSYSLEAELYDWK